MREIKGNNEFITFEEYKLKRFLKLTGMTNQQTEVEILLSVIRFLYAFMENELDDPFGEIHPSKKIDDLFNGNQKRKTFAYKEILHYWEIDSPRTFLYLFNKGIENIYTVSDLFLYVEQQIIDKEGAAY